jgi:hypothetical protein
MVDLSGESPLRIPERVGVSEGEAFEVNKKRVYRL